MEGIIYAFLHLSSKWVIKWFFTAFRSFIFIIWWLLQVRIIFGLFNLKWVTNPRKVLFKFLIFLLKSWFLGKRIWVFWVSWFFWFLWSILFFQLLHTFRYLIGWLKSIECLWVTVICFDLAVWLIKWWCFWFLISPFFWFLKDWYILRYFALHWNFKKIMCFLIIVFFITYLSVSPCSSWNF